MGYVINIESNGFTFKFGKFGYPVGGLGLFIDFADNKVKEAIKKEDSDFYKAIKELLVRDNELDALATMDNFESYYLQGNPWYKLTTFYNFEGLFEFKQKALITLNSIHATPYQLEVAEKIIDVLDGNYKLCSPPPEKSPEEKAKAAFERKKPNLRLKLTIERGYKCDQCSRSQENSLCVIRKDDSLVNYELENLVLRCRSCINKMRKK
jgi:hypothetical protein